MLFNFLKLFACCRSADQNQPRETMEQHLLAYLTNKYGVRQLITQWLTSILAAVEHFSPLDAQTALFGKVLRNEVEEEFEEAQLRVKTTASSLLQSILQVKLGCQCRCHHAPDVHIGSCFTSKPIANSRQGIPDHENQFDSPLPRRIAVLHAVVLLVCFCHLRIPPDRVHAFA